MKIKLLLIALFLSLGMVGCEENTPCTDYTKQERAKKYEWSIGNFGAREGCKTLKQSEHSKVSELDKNNTYRYEPEENFTGTDVVEIETETSSKDGLTGYVTIHRIEFTVTECGLKTAKTVIETKDVKYKKGMLYTCPDLCSKYKIKIKKNVFPPKNLPDKFKTDDELELKVLVNFTSTEEEKYCGFLGFKYFIFINRIKKDIE